MSRYLLCVICCLPLLHTRVSAEDCDFTVLALRRTVIVPVGGTLTLSCKVQHCGKSWTGNWISGNSTSANTVVKESGRHRLSNVSLSADTTQLTLDFLSISELDEGSYGCSVQCGTGETAQGHQTYVNVTAAVPSQRNTLHRVLVLGGAVLCLPVILGLARCLSSRARPQSLPLTSLEYAAVSMDQPDRGPQPLPRSPIPQKEPPVPKKRSNVPPKSQQKSDVVYADISKDALKQQGSSREPAPPTVYSSLRF